MKNPQDTKPLLRALAGESLSSPPVWFLRQAGRYLPEYRDLRQRCPDFLSFCKRPDLTIEATLQPLRRFQLDAAIIFSDILTIPEALGQRVWFEAGEGPRLQPLDSKEAFQKLTAEGLEEKLEPLAESLQGLKPQLPEGVALIGFVGAPWTLAAYMIEGGGSRDFARARLAAYREEESFSALIELLGEALVRSLVLQARSGAEVLMIFDSWAGLLPEAGFRRWCLAPVKAIVAKLKEAGVTAPIIYFPRGAGSSYELCVSEKLPVAALALDTTLGPAWAAKTLQRHFTLQGNLDPVVLVAGGKPLAEAVDRTLEALGSGPFILNAGHGILPQTPPEHLGEVIARATGRKVS